MDDGRNKRQPTGSNGKVHGFHQRQGVAGRKKTLLVASDNRSRSLSSKKASTTSRSSSVRNNHEESPDTRGRSHSTFRKKKEASVLSTEDKDKHNQLSRSSSRSVDRSKSRHSSQRWSSSSTYRSSSTRGDARSQLCRPKSEIGTTKGAVVVGSSSTVHRSRSMSGNRTEAPNKGSAAAKSSAFSTHQGNSGSTKTTASSTRTFVVEVDENMNILKLNEVSASNETNASYKPLLTCRTSRRGSSPQSTRDEGRQNRRRSSSFEPPMPRLGDEVRQNRRRSSSCEPPMTRPSALYYPMMRSSFTSRSRSGLNQSVSFSLPDENTENIINRVSSYSRQVPQIRNVVDFDPSLKDSLSTEATSTINDDEEDSFGFIECEPFRGVPSESTGTISSGSTLAVIASAGEVEQFGQVSSKLSDEENTSTRRSFTGNKPKRHTVPVITHSHRSERDENETSSLMADAASCLEAQQKAQHESKRRSRLYKLIKRYQ
eukprot:CAMPEP_0201723480 /NCGR_PEP_ID=MMETSP0593-20130828/7529_1 /ASSEMBLY_ACC=CAM_ASM_000672 /TAXON_ID=267983 /ORGANISM="Skeletonema japonicum, Strain CCMP2506" /LENGTH=486 /DNA_ID=CAMNT_0048214601 /DNA_START=62 /DNA_END=1522 /DNA_ORIENTATION=+